MKIILCLCCALGFVLSSSIGSFLLLGMGIVSDYKRLIKPVFIFYSLGAIFLIAFFICI
ncbi:hypothetical protein [Candidatus Stoquefichus massiliensis]|uniref:hypothetical protein n=1 Tax=Candidatus Stoquefichus massiliensis TaxID=1470350 RepID=UPI00164ECD34|nr:hypothetical protein [Candidatus Stoquefichus massiliensis]